MKYTGIKAKQYISASAILVIILFTSSVHTCSASTYTYNPQQFEYQNYPQFFGNTIEAMVSFSSLVTPSFTGVIDSWQGLNIDALTSWSLSSGSVIINSEQAYSGLSVYQFTFANGTITEWYIDACSLQGHAFYLVFGNNGRDVDFARTHLAGMATGSTHGDIRSGVTPSSWTNTTPAPVPVPSAMLLLCSGLIGLTVTRRRKKS